MRAVNLWLLCLAILAVLVAVIPEPELCWLPPSAPTRGIYQACWSEVELWAAGNSMTYYPIPYENGRI